MRTGPPTHFPSPPIQARYTQQVNGIPTHLNDDQLLGVFIKALTKVPDPEETPILSQFYDRNGTVGVGDKLPPLLDLIKQGYTPVEKGSASEAIISTCAALENIFKTLDELASYRELYPRTSGNQVHPDGTIDAAWTELCDNIRQHSGNPTDMNPAQLEEKFTRAMVRICRPLTLIDPKTKQPYPEEQNPFVFSEKFDSNNRNHTGWVRAGIAGIIQKMTYSMRWQQNGNTGDDDRFGEMVAAGVTASKLPPEQVRILAKGLYDAALTPEEVGMSRGLSSLEESRRAEQAKDAMLDYLIKTARTFRSNPELDYTRTMRQRIGRSVEQSKVQQPSYNWTPSTVESSNTPERGI